MGDVLPEGTPVRSGTFAAFRHRNYRLLWAGNLISNSGDWLDQVALNWLVISTTNSPIYLGLVNMARGLPLVFFALIGGVVADMVDRRWLLMVTQSCAMLFAVLLAVLVYMGDAPIWVILLLATGRGIVVAFNTPARHSLISELVPRHDLPSAVALNSVVFNISKVIGPLLAAAVISAFGTAACFLANALSFTVVLVMLLMIRLPATAIRAARRESFMASMKQGVRYVRNDSILLLLMLVALVLVFAAFTLSPRASRALGYFAVTVLGLVMLAMATHAPQTFDPTIERIHFAFAAVVLPVISILAGDLSSMRARLKLQKAELQDALTRIHKLATRDDLTGLVNRRHMEELAALEQRRAMRSGSLPCLCLVDIDHFKRINDQHGHAAGDEVLRLFARHAAASMRETDVLARWGGEEFLVIWPGLDLEAGLTEAEHLRATIAQAQFQTLGGQALRVSCSLGVAEHPLHAGRGDWQLSLELADRALYRAKANGRNRVEGARLELAAGEALPSAGETQALDDLARSGRLHFERPRVLRMG